MQKTKLSIGRCILAAVASVFFFICFACFFGAACYTGVYGQTGFDSIIYTLTSPMAGTQSDLLFLFIFRAILPAVLCAAALTVLVFLPMKWKAKLHIWMIPSISLALCLILLLQAGGSVGMIEYLIGQSQRTDLYETQYKDPNDVTITFPEQKRNLIYIYLESMETSFLSTQQGGAMDSCLIPELYDLANSYTNFSHNADVGGLVEVPGITWTAGAMLAQTSGIPMLNPGELSGMNQDGSFLTGLTNLGDILDGAGYYQALMVGSDATYGGRKALYTTHGTDVVYDIYTAREDGVIPEDYFVWWGMEDLHLYEYAKQELTEISQLGQPFAFTMLTVDTHHIGGFSCSLCGNDHEESYDNVYQCASRQVADFVQWIMEQDFYEDTTIVITGDHFSMDAAYFQRVTGGNYVRHGYNCFINAPVDATSTENRQFCALDMFPSTLAAMGCHIEGDRLGLGVNLFSDIPTLIEEFGYEAFCNELRKHTDFYEENFY